MPTADRTELEQRPSPDALLEAAAQEGRGKLKIFLGAAPGVGKTYEMLQAAQAKRREGVDIVIQRERHGNPGRCGAQALKQQVESRQLALAAERQRCRQRCDERKLEAERGQCWTDRRSLAADALGQPGLARIPPARFGAARCQ
jgi:hypothetical protein